MTEKEMLVSILTDQSEILDQMLSEQNKIHSYVSERNWTNLEDSMNVVSILTDKFVLLDTKREALSLDFQSLYKDSAVADKLFEVRSKLSKSKIENQALSAYVNASRKFINGILDRCIPQQRNTLYTRAGFVKKPVSNSVVVNTVF